MLAGAVSALFFNLTDLSSSADVAQLVEQAPCKR